MRNSFLCQSVFAALLGLAPAFSLLAGTDMKSSPDGTRSMAKFPDSKDLGSPIVEATPSDLTWRVGIPGWLAGVDGDVGVKNQLAQTNISFGDVLRHLKGIAVLDGEVQKGNWGFQFNGLYLKLQDDLTTRDQRYSSGHVEFSEVLIDFSASYRLVDQPAFTLDATLGGRFNYLDLQVDLESNRGRVDNFSRSGDEAWCDPVLGLRSTVRVAKPLLINFKGDVGGFGVASHITWQVAGSLELQITRCLYASAGYRYLVTDYSSGGFTWDVAMGGPTVEFGINF